MMTSISPRIFRILSGMSHFAKRNLSTYGSSTTPLILNPSEVQNITKSSARVSLLDATWFMPNSTRKARNEFLEKRLPGAQFLDLDEVASSHELGLAHMMPSETVFAEACGKLGISPSTHVVIYDAHGVFSSPRALFMFRTFGHEKSSIIDGGLPRWINEGLTVDSQLPRPPKETKYPPPKMFSSIRSYEDIVANSALDPTELDTELVLDARSHGRFTGVDPEPRPGLSSGHIPNSCSLPFSVFLQNHTSAFGVKYTTLLPKEEIKNALYNAVGREQGERIIKGEKPVVTSCGSGMTAGVIWLGLKLIGVQNIGLYDESWTGYAMRPASKIEITK